MDEMNILDKPTPGAESPKINTPVAGEISASAPLHPIVDAALVGISNKLRENEGEVAGYVARRHPKGFRAKETSWTIFNGLREQVVDYLVNEFPMAVGYLEMVAAQKRAFRLALASVASFGLGLLSGAYLL